ncbi:LysM peptidoglycan-binding domain-containing protein [bacterium]|nr:LysM peptidoglycan-binding domain-containing protein [bacterium]
MPAEAPQQPAFEEPLDFFEVGSEEPGLRIYLRYDLFRALDEYAVRDTSRELAALLVGQIHESGQGNCIVVEDAIEIGVGDEREGRFSPRVWQHARRVARTRYVNKVIVGWYHTHPGTGLDLSQEEREVHKSFFPEAWQVMYVVDPVSRDRNFYRSQESRLSGVRGFRIFGKEAAALREKPAVTGQAPAAPPRNEEALRERYLERSLEKILRSQRRPPSRPVDLLIVGLLVANLLAILLRPAPTAKVDLSPLATPIQRVAVQVSGMTKRLDKLEKHLADLQVLDEQLAGPTPDVSATPGESSSPVALGKAPPDGSKEIVEHRVKEGDTLSLIAEQYYGSAGSSLVGALAKYNKLRGNEIFPGDTLKIPARDHLP